MTLKIINKAERIKSINIFDNPNRVVGQSGVISIEPYEEAGEMANVLWFRVIFSEMKEERYNGKFIIGVSYK